MATELWVLLLFFVYFVFWFLLFVYSRMIDSLIMFVSVLSFGLSVWVKGFWTFWKVGGWTFQFLWKAWHAMIGSQTNADDIAKQIDTCVDSDIYAAAIEDDERLLRVSCFVSTVPRHMRSSCELCKVELATRHLCRECARKGASARPRQ